MQDTIKKKMSKLAIATFGLAILGGIVFVIDISGFVFIKRNIREAFFTLLATTTLVLGGASLKEIKKRGYKGKVFAIIGMILAIFLFLSEVILVTYPCC